MSFHLSAAMPTHKRPLAALCATLLALALSSPAWAQNDRALTDYIDVRVLNMEVVVTDRDGQPIPDLERGDFTLKIDGETVPIEFFNEVRDGQVLPSDRSSSQLEPGTPANTSIVVFIDEFFSIARDKNIVLRGLKERAAELQPGTRVAIVAWAGERLEFLTDGWESDSTALVKAFDEAIARPSQGLQRVSERRTWNVTTHPDDMARARRRASFDPFSLTTEERMYAGRLVDQLRATTGAAAASMGQLEAPAGRKALMILSGGWPMDPATWIARDPMRAVQDQNIPRGDALYGTIADVANLLGYSVYGVDVPGLQATGPADVSRRSPTPMAITSAEFMMEMELHDSLAFLASRTGGQALLNAQRLRALDDVALGFRNHYWLGFTPTFARDDTRRDIEVDVADPDLRVRVRSDFVDASPIQQVEWAVSAALLQPSERAARDFEIELGEPERVARRRFERTLTLRIPSHQLSFVETKDGFTAAVDVLFAAVDRNGGRSEVQQETLTVTGPQRPDKGDMVSWQTSLIMNNRTARVGVALFDRVGNQAFASVVDVP